MNTNPTLPSNRDDAAAGTFSGQRTDRPRLRHGNTETEQTFLDAAERILDRDGFVQLSVARIIEESGLSRATFYHYFSSRLSVVASLLDRVMRDLLEVGRPFLFRPERNLSESIASSIQSAVQLWSAHRPVLHAVMENWTSDRELEVRWKAAMGHFIDAVSSEIDRGRDAGLVPDGLASRELAAALVWGTERILHVAGRDVLQGGHGEEAAVESLIQMWCGTLGLDRGEAAGSRSQA